MKVFTTLLSDESYLDGVLVLNRALTAVKSRYPLYCVVSSNIRDDLEKSLYAEGVKTIRLKKQITTPKSISNDYCYAHWNKTFDKLQIWGLTQFEKIVFLDSDLLVIHNVDSLFDRAPFSGVCAGKSYPGNEDWRGINSGVMVIKPDKNVEASLIGLIPLVAQEYERIGRLMGDQDIIQWYLTDKWNEKSSLQIDEGYNIFADFLDYYIKRWAIHGRPKIKPNKFILCTL